MRVTPGPASGGHTYIVQRASFSPDGERFVAGDLHGSLIAAGDDGGCDETAMGMRTAEGDPQVTLIDAGRSSVIGAIEQAHSIFGLEYDPWRGRLLTVLHRDVGVWSRTGEAICRFAPYESAYARAVAVSERWIATAPDTGDHAQIDFFDPETYERRATVELDGRFSPAWIAASPDGRTLVTPEFPVNRDYAVRIWTVE